ncbi:MAG: hypothetical protein WA020_11015, partial [Candidatus Acidiferrales bacterium]
YISFAWAICPAATASVALSFFEGRCNRKEDSSNCPNQPVTKETAAHLATNTKLSASRRHGEEKVNRYTKHKSLLRNSRKTKEKRFSNRD